jgi:hypothetical protein
LEKAGFRIARRGKHIVMTDGVRIVTIPRQPTEADSGTPLLVSFRVAVILRQVINRE